MSPPFIRVLIADDSATVRASLSRTLAEHPDLVVVGSASDGEEVVEMAHRLKPDVITMDVVMPKLDGLAATAQIMSECPTRILVVCAVSEQRQVNMSFRAMVAGALEVISKPWPPESGGGASWGNRVAQAIRTMAQVPVSQRKQVVAAPPPIAREGRAHILGVVSSTGGPAAVAKILSALPSSFPAPILIAQHIAPGFGAGLRRWFSEISRIPVLEAEDEMPCESGRVLLPPDGHDMEVDEEGCVRLTRNDNLLCPNGDKLLASIAKAYGDKSAGVVLSGMGQDGARGLIEIRASGGDTLAQDEASSVVFGMPQAAVQLGGTDRLVPLDHMARVWTSLCARVCRAPARRRRHA